jgi:primosomal protein N' (replication factor Y)
MIASILVDVNAREVDKTFDYHIPAHLQDVIEIGQRVSVPFGYRFILGYVLDIKEHTEMEELKDIVDVIDLVPSLTTELIELGKHLSISNTSPLVSIYQAMLPRALKGKYSKKLIVKDPGLLPLDLSLKFNQFKEAKLDDSLYPFLREIKKQIEEKNMEVIHVIGQQNRVRYIKKLVLLDETIPVKGKKQQEVLAYMIDHQEAYKKNVMIETNTSSPTIKSLVDKGIVEEKEVEIYREIETLYGDVDKDIILNEEQVLVYDRIKESLGKNETFLLHGITGSGKTEIYLNIIEDVVKQGKEAIMLVPEISLTPMMVSRFRGRFGDNVALLHSGLSIGERYDEWRKIRRKEVQVCVGARSAIFAPFEHIGVIIIDEEHTESYKQETNPRYHAKDVAIQRTKRYQVPLVLGSATPSIESYYKATHNQYTLLEMKHRAKDSLLPKVYIEDMRFEFKGGNRSIFSTRLETLIKDRLEKKEQIILLLNRRGHSTFVMCRSCGEVIMCPNCDISLTYHERDNSLQCHYCGHKAQNVTVCPTCQSKHIRYMGIGTERVEEYIKEAFPSAHVVRMDRDTTTYKNAHEKLLHDFEQRGDILLGTQMIAKGLDFPNVTLVGVLAADMSLNLPDYKAIEKTFQLLTQVSGRAGRHDKEGEVVIQTYNPEHYAIAYAEHHDYHSFYATEMKIREISGYTPFNHLVQIIVSDKDVRKLLKEGTKIVLKLRKNLESDMVILGPVLPKIARINNYYRAQIIIKYKQSTKLDPVLQDIYQEFSDTVTIAIDKNPTLL